jgi:hypothetical protein
MTTFQVKMGHLKRTHYDLVRLNDSLPSAHLTKALRVLRPTDKSKRLMGTMKRRPCTPMNRQGKLSCNCSYIVSYGLVGRRQAGIAVAGYVDSTMLR